MARQVCKAIRQNQFSVPILILSALDTPDIIADVLNAGADDYLVKPVSQSILHAYITEVRPVQTNWSIDRFTRRLFNLAFHSRIIINKRENLPCKFVLFAIPNHPIQRLPVRHVRQP